MTQIERNYEGVQADRPTCDYCGMEFHKDSLSSIMFEAQGRKETRNICPDCLIDLPENLNTN